MKVVVVGAGAAGVAAAVQARALGASVRLFYDQAGATDLGSGALDFEPWTVGFSSVVPDQVTDFCEALGIWQVVPGGAQIVTKAGVVRPAAGIDRALLDLAPLSGKRIAVADIERDDWDAPLLARSAQQSEWAARTETEFVAVRVELMREPFERRIAAYDFALLLDDPERLDGFVSELEGAGEFDAWLVGPWLGLEPEVLQRVRQRLSVPVGETTSLPGGPAGARFELAARKLLDRAGVEVRRARVRSVERSHGRWRVMVGEEPFTADAVVLCTGGLVSGGIVLDQADEQVKHGGFRLSLTAPVKMFVKGRSNESVASLHGFDFTEYGLSVLSRVGALPTSEALGLRLAGDLLAGSSNTVLHAVHSGCSAAAELCSQFASGEIEVGS
jgi:anaerobic glycerol-3-phosphate dehydrogenase